MTETTQAGTTTQAASVGTRLWFTRRLGVVRGPFPERQISRYILLGRIREDDELSLDGTHWKPVHQLPELIPDVMKNVRTEADRQRLLAARAREDERRPGDRRRAPQRMEAGEPDRRRGDRRRSEPEFILRHRQLRESLAASPPARPSRLAVVALALAILTLGAMGLYVYSRMPVLGAVAACNAPPGPAVNWNNCKLAGLEADHADLDGAWIRNTDLTGASLVATRLTDADLSYSTLNMADLRLADLRRARMVGAGLRGADLRGARLAGADLAYADLRGVRLATDSLAGVRLDHALWVDGRECAPGSVAACRPLVPATPRR